MIFDAEKRFFSGQIIWDPATYCGGATFDIDMVFSEEYDCVESGLWKFMDKKGNKSHDEQSSQFKRVRVGSSELKNLAT